MESEENKETGHKTRSEKLSITGEITQKNQLTKIEFLNELELEAGRIATSVDDLTENLSGILRSISALTLDCLQTYRNCICRTCDAIDLNIKLMYQLMAKCEELNKLSHPLTQLSINVKDFRNIIDQFEQAVNA